MNASKEGSRSIDNDVVSIISGFIYHDIAGGNDLMKVKGNWNNNYSKGEIEWLGKTDEEKLEAIEKGMKDIGEKLKEAKKKWIDGTR